MQKIDMFSNHIYSNIELVRNNALMGRGIYHDYGSSTSCEKPNSIGLCLVHPQAWKVILMTNDARGSPDQ